MCYLMRYVFLLKVHICFGNVYKKIYLDQATLEKIIFNNCWLFLKLFQLIYLFCYWCICWNIQISELCLNWDSINAFKIIFLPSKERNLDIQDKAKNFLLALEHNFETCLSKLRFLSIVTPNILYLIFKTHN